MTQNSGSENNGGPGRKTHRTAKYPPCDDNSLLRFRRGIKRVSSSKSASRRLVATPTSSDSFTSLHHVAQKSPSDAAPARSTAAARSRRRDKRLPQHGTYENAVAQPKNWGRKSWKKPLPQNWRRRLSHLDATSPSSFTFSGDTNGNVVLPSLVNEPTVSRGTITTDTSQVNGSERMWGSKLWLHAPPFRRVSRERPVLDLSAAMSSNASLVVSPGCSRLEHVSEIRQCVRSGVRHRSRSRSLKRLSERCSVTNDRNIARQIYVRTEIMTLESGAEGEHNAQTSCLKSRVTSGLSDNLIRNAI